MAPVVIKLYIWVIDQVGGQDGWILSKTSSFSVHKLAKKE